MVMSSAYVVMFVCSVCGNGRSAVNKLKSDGDRMAPWGTPFFMFTVLDFCPLS